MTYTERHGNRLVTLEGDCDSSNVLDYSVPDADEQHAFAPGVVRYLLPQRSDRRLVTSVVEYAPDGLLVAEYQVPAHATWIHSHFPGAPVMPGVDILEGMAQATILKYRLDHMSPGDREQLDRIAHTTKNLFLQWAFDQPWLVEWFIGKFQMLYGKLPYFREGKVELRGKVFPGDTIRYVIEPLVEKRMIVRAETKAFKGELEVARGEVKGVLL